MNQITEPGNPKSFGHEFNYAVWTANNIFTLCNVPWNSDYRDVAAFRTTEEFDAFIDATPSSTRVSIEGTRARFNMPIRLGMTLAKAMKYNYLRVKNGLQPVESGDESQTFYYFIVGMREVAPETTEVLLQLDVWASFSPSITGCRGFVERGHIGMANTKRMRNNGRDYLSVPEGLDTGSEYVGIFTVNRRVMHTGNMNVVMVIASDPDAEPYKSIDGKSVPNYTSAKGSNFQGVYSGAAIRVFYTVQGFMDWMTARSERPWQTQSILSIMLVPSISRYFPGWSGTTGPSEPPNFKPSDYTYENNWSEWRSLILDKIPARYKALDKFLTSPYMLIELTAFSGTPIVIKPENWNNSNADITTRINFMPPNARMQLRPDNYNAPNGGNGSGDFRDDDTGSYWDFFTQITAFPTVPIVNDGAILALANQANSLAYAAHSADWSQQKALSGAQTGYDQASSAMQLSSDQLANQQAGDLVQNQIANDLTRANVLGGIVSGIGGGAGMGAFAGPGGAIAGGVGGIVSGISQAVSATNAIEAGNNALNARQSTQNAANARQNEFGAYIRDSNADLARFAARGDYENTMAGIKASVQDTMMTPASVVGQSGGELINLINDTLGFSIRWKMLDLASMRSIGEHWLRYGYAVQQSARVPDSFMVMDRFTYWKMSETYLQGARIPENFRQALRGILEKGTTFWANPWDMNDPDFDIANNNPLSGVTLP